MSRGMCIGNCVGRQNWNGKISGTIMHTPEKVVENTGFKDLWDFNKLNSVIGWLKLQSARHYIFVPDKQAKEAKIIDIAIPGDAQVKDKELEKTEKY